jgi:ABC-type lipoprotein release transport system permease subunit
MLKLAWRNIWRNKRRTLITSASIFFGVILSAMMSSMQEGSYELYIKAIVNFYSGYIQVHKNGYWNDKTINNSLEYSPVKPLLTQIKEITQFAPRMENFALASIEETTKGVMVIGIKPSNEDNITNLSKKIIEGKYLVNGDTGIILGSALAKYMNINTNDTLVLLSQGYHGVSAAGKYPVRGIIKHPSPQMDRSVVYMDITNCQDFFSAQDMLTSIVIMVNNIDDVETVKNKLSAHLGGNYEVMDWKEMNRILIKQIESDRSSGIIMKGILYMIIAFGIFGTIMMMTLERRKEFGVLIAVGMQKYKLNYVLVLETIFIGLIGSISGIIACIPITWYMFFHPVRFSGQAADYLIQTGFEPVMPFSMAPFIFYNQALTIFIFTLFISLYPVINTNRLKINKALRG